MAKNLNKRNIVTRLTQKKELLMMTATKNPNGKKSESHCCKKKNNRLVSLRDKDSNPDGSSGDSFAALRERPTRLSGQGVSDSDDDGRGQRRSRCKLRVAYSLKVMLARAVPYGEYQLLSNKTGYRDLSGHVPCFGMMIEGKTRPQDFFGSDSTASLSFLAVSSDTCILSRVPESSVLWCF